jgi:CheY-like chemotaxis protein
MNFIMDSEKQFMDIQFDSKRQCVLIADSDAEFLKVTSQNLESAGYRAIQAKDGREALRILQGNSNFAICIFESNLPLLEAMEIVRFMRNERRLVQIPIILMGADGSVKTQTESFSVEDVVFLPKPFRQPQLITMISVLTQNRLKKIHRLNQPSNPISTGNKLDTKYDRRLANRIKVNFEASWEGRDGRHQGRVCNISTHGCYVASAETTGEDELVLLEIHLPTKDRVIKAWGIVANSLPEVGFGVRFTNINRDDSNFIREMVQKSLLQLHNLQPIVSQPSFISL